MASKMEEAVNIKKLVHEYLSQFHGHYKLPRHFCDDPLIQWCRLNLGKEYKDWSYHLGHRDDPHSVLHIKDPKWCTIFELKWAHLIIGQLDIK